VYCCDFSSRLILLTALPFLPLKQVACSENNACTPNTVLAISAETFKHDQSTNQPTKDVTEGGDLRKAQVDVPRPV